MLKLSKRSRQGREHDGVNDRADSDPEVPVFYFDDCCPLCRGYTAVFAGLGLAGRQGFSTIDACALDDLDLPRARHQIPLRDGATGRVAYGLDGILGLVGGRYRWLRPVVELGPIRRILDGFYWLVTYNRRHIVAAPPPAAGVDCAPDFHRPAVTAYLGFCAVVAPTLAVAAGAGPVTLLTVAVSALGAAALVLLRRPGWGLNRWQAMGHVGSVAVASAVAGAAGAILAAAGLGLFGVGGSTGAWSQVAAVGAAAAVGARKLWLRRWLLQDR